MTKINEISFENSIENISQIFRKHSLEDILVSLFISNIWLPNISSPVQHQFLYAILLTIKSGDFKKSNKINSYKDFNNFLEKIYSLVPSFFPIEDYIPEPDWGNIKFFSHNKLFKIFYGVELEIIYDLLESYKIIYSSLDDKFQKFTGRSPKQELFYCLKLQDQIISSINNKLDNKAKQNLSPGYKEIPPLKFWKEVNEFYSKLKPEKYVDLDFLEKFSIKEGRFPITSLDERSFLSNVYSGKIIPYFFIKRDQDYFIFLPRRYSGILIDSWTKEFKKIYKILNEEISFNMYFNVEIYKYLRDRINKTHLFPISSAVNNEGSPHEIIYSASLISKNQIFLIYICNPFFSKKEINDELIKLNSRFKESIKMIEKPPVTLALHAKRENISFKSRESEENLKPILIVILPQISTSDIGIKIPDNFPGELISLKDFLAIIDEIEKTDELASFFDYLREYNKKIRFPLIGILDKFASFKDTHGVLVKGAVDYTHIGLDPHWGTSKRYESLSHFWDLYPSADLYGHPRSRNVIREAPTRIRLDEKGFFGCFLYRLIGQTHFFTTSPFDQMSFEQAQIANFLMECLEDTISRLKKLIINHSFFKRYKQFHVNFFPHSFIRQNKNFRHLNHLDPKGECWDSDIGFIKSDIPGVRVVYNDKLIVDKFKKAKDASLEINLLSEILVQLNKNSPDSNFESIIAELSKLKSNSPRFKLFHVQKEVSFPELTQICEPSIMHIKKANKKIAEIAKEINISPGNYKIDNAKVILNNLRSSIIEKIDSEVKNFDYQKSIPFLITRIDALNNKIWRKRRTIEYSLEHEVDYDRGERFAKEHGEFVLHHRNYRYLIEKFVQLNPGGNSKINKEKFQNLIALINRLQEIYNASDSIHYDVYPTGIKIYYDYSVEVLYQDGLDSKQKSFSKEQVEINLGLKGELRDRVGFQISVEEYYQKMNSASLIDLKFRIDNMFTILHMLSQWPLFAESINEDSFYSSNKEVLLETCKTKIKDIETEETYFILDFLTLKSNDVIRIIGQDNPCEDLPVWEHNKRFSRYNLKPLILINNRYYWGPHSARKSGEIWSKILRSGPIPLENCPTIKKILKEEKKAEEDALLDITFEAMQRETIFVERNVKLHKRDKFGNHSPNLGDYDVLAFHQEKNVVFNIECKDISYSYCLKDSKRVRDRIFGKDKRRQGYLGQVEKRQVYLKKNIISIAKVLKWPLGTKNPRVIPLFVTSHSFWWTKFPPRSTGIIFLSIKVLSESIKHLIRNNN